MLVFMRVRFATVSIPRLVEHIGLGVWVAMAIDNSFKLWPGGCSH